MTSKSDTLGEKILLKCLRACITLSDEDRAEIKHIVDDLRLNMFSVLRPFDLLLVMNDNSCSTTPVHQNQIHQAGIVVTHNILNDERLQKNMMYVVGIDSKTPVPITEIAQKYFDHRLAFARLKDNPWNESNANSDTLAARTTAFRNTILRYMNGHTGEEEEDAQYIKTHSFWGLSKKQKYRPKNHLNFLLLLYTHLGVIDLPSLNKTHPEKLHLNDLPCLIGPTQQRIFNPVVDL